MPTAIAGPQGLNMNDLDVGQLVLGTVTDENSTAYIASFRVHGRGVTGFDSWPTKGPEPGSG